MTGPKKELTFGVISPEAMGLFAGILHIIQDRRFRCCGLKMVHLTRSQLETLFSDQPEEAERLALQLTVGPCLVFVLESEDAVHRWKSAMGTTEPDLKNAGTINGRFKRDGREVCWGSSTPEQATRQIMCLFDRHEIFSDLNPYLPNQDDKPLRLPTTTFP